MNTLVRRRGARSATAEPSAPRGAAARASSRHKRRLIVLLATVGIVAAGCIPPPPPPPAPTLTEFPGPPVQINGLDLHDGMISKLGSTYYLYGTEYGCGFVWQDASTPWCGYGVSTASSVNGPWSAPSLLFSPTAWQTACRGAGCFSPRMIQRPSDGAFLLWFNVPSDNINSGTNAYYVMTCSGPTGPCGNPHKPSLSVCVGVGDFSIVFDDSGSPWIFCTLPFLVLAEEKLTPAGTDGTGLGGTKLAGLGNVEALDAYHDLAAGTWVLTYSDPSCGFCSGGVATGYATSPDIAGPWTARGNLSDRSCGGQPRKVDDLDGQKYEQVDQWYGSFNETNANTVLAPLARMECPPTQSQSTTSGTAPPSTRTTTTAPTTTTTVPSSTTTSPTTTPTTTGSAPSGTAP